jgi:hypothetical protein
MKYIYHHLGLGDHIICNGLVRSLIDENEVYTMFVKPHNKQTVEFMYKDLKNLFFIEGDDSFVRHFLSYNSINPSDIIVAGFENLPPASHFDESFYLQNNIPFINRWEKFKVERDLEKELELFSKFEVKENEYVFIHDDSSRGYIIDEDLVINKNLKIIRPVIGYTDNIFHYCYLMQNSIESHFIDSSFRLIFDSLKLRNTNIFYHLKLKNGMRRNSHEFYDSSVGLLNYKVII